MGARANIGVRWFRVDGDMVRRDEQIIEEFHQAQALRCMRCGSADVVFAFDPFFLDEPIRQCQDCGWLRLPRRMEDEILRMYDEGLWGRGIYVREVRGSREEWFKRNYLNEWVP